MPAPSGIHHNPYGDGVTGLDTYLWADPQTPQTSRTSIRGYPVVCTATPVEWRWSSGDGGRYAAATPGGPHPAEAAAHQYETKGGYTLSLDVAWALDTNYGRGSLLRSSNMPYRVIEIRSVLLPAD